ncbi:hypothetical protein KFK09_001533 [Dendrobium nobile]|uniref:Uncharacterized protein n=1 Tax=Dendrobium nobile TaxID=94219 RepID=A0A8T3C7P4_DENNO|nr:hypothetical protein KFK09_001533 [Dendrobium nobile]
MEALKILERHMDFVVRVQISMIICGPLCTILASTLRYQYNQFSNCSNLAQGVLHILYVDLKRSILALSTEPVWVWGSVPSHALPASDSVFFCSLCIYYQCFGLNSFILPTIL